MGAVIPFIPRTVPESGFYDGPILTPLPAGWIYLRTAFRFGPDGDEKDVSTVQGPLRGEHADYWLVEVYGEVVTYPRERRGVGLGAPVLRPGWVEVRRG